MAPKVAALMAAELQKDETWQTEQVRNFTALAKDYILV
jgi:glycerol-3-phosphate dehydrogenase